MDLQVAAVHAIVVVDHHLRQLHILVGQRLQHAVKLLHDQIEAAQRARLQVLQLLLEVQAALRARGASGRGGGTQAGNRAGARARVVPRARGRRRRA